MKYISRSDNSKEVELFSLFRGNSLSEPGDYINAKITPSGRQVIKLNVGGECLSATRYSTGTITVTKVFRPVDN